MGSQQAVLNREEMEYRHCALEVEHDWEAEAGEMNRGGGQGHSRRARCNGRRSRHVHTLGQPVFAEWVGWR